MALPPLNLVISADASQLNTALNVAQRNATRAAVAITAALGGIGVALIDQTRRGLQFVDSQVKAARAMDATADGLRAVQIAASDAGVSMQSMSRDLQTMTRELSRAATEGGPPAEALERLGLAASDLEGLDVDRRIALISDRMRQMGMTAGQASRVMQQLGVRNREMALLMLQGGDAIRDARHELEEFGLSISEDVAAQVEATNDAMSRIGMVFERLQVQLAANMAPILQNLSQRFTEMARAGGPLATAIDNVAEAFAELADRLLTPEAIDAVTSAFTGFIGLMESGVNAMIFFSDNLGLMTAGMGAAAVAIAALGGPLTLIVGLLGGAALGFATLRARAREAVGPMASYQEAVESAKEGQEALNAALGVFRDTGAPNAAESAIDLANENIELARSAIAAARAEIAKAQAIRESIAAERSGGRSGRRRAERRQAIEDEAAATEALAKAEQMLADALDARDEGVRGFTGAVDLPGITFDTEDEDDDDSPIAPGVSGAGRLQDDLADRLAILQQGLMTEQEAAQEFYDSGLELLKEAREAGLLTEQEYMELRERLEEEHQNRLNAIRDAGHQTALSAIVSTGEEILAAVGRNNRRAAQAARAFGQFEAMINAYRAAAQVLADPTVPWFQKLSAAGSVLAAGIGFASSIRNMSGSGSGGSASAGGGGGGGGEPQAMPVQRMMIETVGTGPVPQSSLEGIIEQINEAGRQGYRIDAQFVGGR